MESKFGIMAAPSAIPSSTLAPLSMNPFADSRWPLTGNNPGFSPPEGATAPKLPPEDVLDVALVVTGTTPVCTASRSVLAAAVQRHLLNSLARDRLAQLGVRLLPNSNRRE